MVEQIKTMRQLFSVLSKGARLVQRFRPRWEGDAPKDRYHVQHEAIAMPISQGLAIAAIRTSRLNRFESTNLGPEWGLISDQKEGSMNAVAIEVAATARRFTKVGADGRDLADEAPAWDAVRDNVTGLMWTAEHKQVAHWNKAAAAAKRFKAAGFKDWRLPTVEELFLLADRTRVSPAIDTTYFPKCKSDWYWTSTPAASSPGGYAWLVDFSNGGAGWYNQGHTGLVRAVRASQ